MVLFYINLVFLLVANPIYIYLNWNQMQWILNFYTTTGNYFGFVFKSNYFIEYGLLNKIFALCTSYILVYITFYLLLFFITLFKELFSGPLKDARFRTGFKNNEIPDTFIEKIVYSAESPFLWMPVLFIIIYVVKLYFYLSS